MLRLFPIRLRAGCTLLIVLVLIACGSVSAPASQQVQVRPMPSGPALLADDGRSPSIQSAVTMAEASASAAAAPTAIPAVAPPASPTPLPLEQYLARLRSMQFAPVLDHLQALPPAERDDPFFGINDALAAEDVTAPIMRGVGASLDRLELRWDQLEPAPGVFDFAHLDDLMTSAGRLDFSVLAVVDGTPPWATGATEDGAAVPNGLNEPAFLVDGSANPANPWATFLATVGARYGSHIVAWEIWNEPNSAEFWHGTPQQYARLYAVAATVLERQEPAASVIVGGQVSDDGGFLQAVAQALCSTAPCQGALLHDVAWHVYDNPADVSRLAALTRAMLKPFGVAPEIWITEANVPVVDPAAPGDAVNGPDAVSLEQQAAFVLQVYVLARVAGVHSLAIYRAADVDDQGHYWGLVRGDFTARPALLAYRTAAQWLSHTQLVTVRHPGPAVTLAGFCRQDATVEVGWTDAPTPVSIHIDASAPVASVVRANGATTAIAAVNGTINVTLPAAAVATSVTVPLGEPILLVVPRGCPTGS